MKEKMLGNMMECNGVKLGKCFIFEMIISFIIEL